MKTNCGWCASKIVTEETEKMHGAPLCADCSSLVQGGSGRSPQEILDGAKVAAFIWFCLLAMVVVFGVWAGMSV